MNLLKAQYSKFLLSLLITFKICFALVLGFAPQTAHMAGLSGEGIFELTNYARQEENVSQLTYSDILERSATAKVSHMLKNNYFDHDSPSGLTPWYWFKEYGYDYFFAGENLATDFATSKSIHDAWMASETHRDNILNPLFKEMGVGIVKGKLNNKVTTAVATHFGTAINTTNIKGTMTTVVNDRKLFSFGDSKLEIIINYFYLVFVGLFTGYFIYILYRKFIKKKQIERVTILKNLSIWIILLILFFI